jgi:hypothetical protein
MKTLGLSSFSGLFACMVAFSLLGDVCGQTAVPPPPASSDLLRIRKVSDLGRDFLQNSPVMGNRSAKQKKWGVIDVTFDTTPEWIDELMVTYSVMLRNKKPQPNEPEFSLLTLTVAYRDIARGRDHKTGVVILPVAMERHGTPIGIGAQIFHDGQLVAESGLGADSLSSQARWWADPRITEGQNVRKRDGYMIDRAKSPFALVDIDSYEVSR